MAELKQKQKFEQQWNRMLTLTGERTPEKAVKFPESEVVTLFKEVAEGRVKKAKEIFKTQLEGILDAKLALDKTLKQGRDELAKKEEKEYEALNNELNKAYGMLETAQKQGQQLVQTAAGQSTEESKPEEEGKEQTDTPA